MNSPIINRCIYCGTINPPLDREHIVPYGLGGKFTLLKASCKKCSKITSEFERDVLKKLLLTTRAALGLKSRHGKLPNGFPVIIESKNKETIMLPIEKHGLVTMLPVFAPPVFLDKRNYEKGIDILGQVVFRTGGMDLIEYAKREKIKSISFTWQYSPTSFARMLAKIAYGFSVYKHGLNRYEEAYVLPSILNLKDDVGRWVGMLPSPVDGPLPNEDFVINFFKNPKNEEFAQIRLFGKFADTPTYIVALGKIK